MFVRQEAKTHRKFVPQVGQLGEVGLHLQRHPSAKLVHFTMVSMVSVLHPPQMSQTSHMTCSR